MNHWSTWVFAGSGLLWAGLALSQTNFPTQTPNINAGGQVDMCQNSTGVAVPCSGITPLPVEVVKLPDQNAPLPSNAVAITGNASGTTGAVVGTLAAAPQKTTWICGFIVSAIGGVAVVGPITVAGLTGSSMTFQFASLATGANLQQYFAPCIPAATANTAITITTTADGTATAVNVNSWGFQR